MSVGLPCNLSWPLTCSPVRFSCASPTPRWLSPAATWEGISAPGCPWHVSARWRGWPATAASEPTFLSTCAEWRPAPQQDHPADSGACEHTQRPGAAPQPSHAPWTHLSASKGPAALFYQNHLCAVSGWARAAPGHQPCIQPGWNGHLIRAHKLSCPRLHLAGAQWPRLCAAPAFRPSATAGSWPGGRVTSAEPPAASHLRSPWRSRHHSILPWQPCSHFLSTPGPAIPGTPRPGLYCGLQHNPTCCYHPTQGPISPSHCHPSPYQPFPQCHRFHDLQPSGPQGPAAHTQGPPESEGSHRQHSRGFL